MYNQVRNSIRRKENEIRKINRQTDPDKYGELVKEIKDLKVRLRTLIPRDPKTVPTKIQYVRYADDWIVGINGPYWMVQQIKSRISVFLKETLGLELSEDKTRISYIRKQFVLFLGYNLKIDVSRKVTTYIDKRGRSVTRRTTGHIIKFYLPIERYLGRLSLKGFCEKDGKARSMPQWIGLPHEAIIRAYNNVLDGTFSYYSHIQNTDDLRRIQFILQMSCAKTLAHKFKMSAYGVFSKFGKNMRVDIKTENKTFVYQLHIRNTIKRNQEWKIGSKPMDPFQVQVNLRSRSKLDAHCAICMSNNNVEMHHVRHVRKAKTTKGFDRLLGIINRKQLPICRECHMKIHAGTYDGFKLSDLAELQLARF